MALSRVNLGADISNDLSLSGQPAANPYSPPIGASLSNPFITGVKQPPSSLVGTSISSFFNVPFRTPRNDQWTASIQQAGKNFVAEIGYTGSRGEHLWSSKECAEHFRAQPGERASSASSEPVLRRNHYRYFELKDGSTGSADDTYPQYTGVSQKRDPEGDSIYHALTARLDKRFSHGYSILAAYTWSKLIDDVPERFAGRSYISDPHSRTARALGDYDAPQVFSVAHVLDLPFGARQRYLTHGPAAIILGGWQLNGILRMQSGYPISIASPNEANVSGFASYANKIHSGRPTTTPLVERMV